MSVKYTLWGLVVRCRKVHFLAAGFYFQRQTPSLHSTSTIALPFTLQGLPTCLVYWVNQRPPICFTVGSSLVKPLLSFG